MHRRDLLKMAGSGMAASVVPGSEAGYALQGTGADQIGAVTAWMNVRQFGAKGDGATTDSPAINRAIDAAAAAGGGTVFFPAGVYLSYSIRLKSNITLYLDHGATIVAANA